jgi:hypothetical protein
MSFVDHISARRLARRLLENKGMRLGRGYLRQAEEELSSFLGDEDKGKWLEVLKIRNV